MIRLLALVQIVTVAGLVAVTLYTWDTRLVMLEQDRALVALQARAAKLEQEQIRAQRVAPPMVTAPAPAASIPKYDGQPAKRWGARRLIELERRIVEMEAVR